jgi:phosphoribosyl-ATP pyrophosphohydrolase/phosphoribosyl-AMP cyclohydrolase/histidinol dehydrogenase
MSDARLRRITPEDLPALRRDAVDTDTLSIASSIVEDVRARGEVALREHATSLGDLPDGASLVIERPYLNAALDTLPRGDRELLERTADRIRAFAQAQRAALTDAEIPVPGGAAGHTVAPVDRAGCYAPGGRFPLPSSVLMTALTARVAGVSEVWVASPRPTQTTLAAAAVAGADSFLTVGGAQAIAALAYGAGPVPPVDVIVGPGNRFVTAAKQLVSGRVRIDMLAGPSELVVLCDASADPETVAADLLAQAEHDPDALPVVVSTDAAVLDRVDEAISRQLATLSTAATASLAIADGYSVLCDDLDAAIAVCDRLAPEHLELSLAGAAALAPRFQHYGGLFIGEGSAEVLGDYGAGPNHVLPTGSTARFTGGLSVFDFLRVRTWLRIDDPQAVRPLAQDAARLARLEGLEAHARAAERRT